MIAISTEMGLDDHSHIPDGICVDMTKATPFRAGRSKMGFFAQFLMLFRQSVLGASAITFLAFSGSIFTGSIFDVYQCMKVFGIGAIAILAIGAWFSLEWFHSAQIDEFNRGPKGRAYDDD